MMLRERSKKLRHRLKITAVRFNFTRATIEESQNFDSMNRHNIRYSAESRGRVPIQKNISIVAQLSLRRNDANNRVATDELALTA